MQVKKFEAPTIQEALKVIKRELGPEAIILSTKENKKGFGLMSKNSVEVTAAISEKDLKKKLQAEKGLPKEVKEKIWNGSAEKQADIYNTYFERQLKASGKDKVEIGAASRAKRQAEERAILSQATATAVEEDEPLLSNVRETRYADIMDDEGARPARNTQRQATQQAQSQNQAQANARSRLNVSVPAIEKSEKVKSLEQDIEQLKAIITDLSKSQASSLQAREINDHFLESDAQMELVQNLVGSGIEKRFARELAKKVFFDLVGPERENESAVQDKLAELLYEDVKVANILASVGTKAEGSGGASVISFVGPTGVGKTTTLAKIASKAILENKLRVGLINLDSYKVAAADQLSTYARIMGVPFRSVASPEELQQAIYDFNSLDLILVDTTGRSQKDQENLLQLKNVLAGIEGMRSVLMVSATTRDADLNDVLSRFKIFNPSGIVFSKLDETGVYGAIYNAHKRTGLPLLYFTVGQRVPEDIEIASKERVVDLILDL